MPPLGPRKHEVALTDEEQRLARERRLLQDGPYESMRSLADGRAVDLAFERSVEVEYIVDGEATAAKTETAHTGLRRLPELGIYTRPAASTDEEAWIGHFTLSKTCDDGKVSMNDPSDRDRTWTDREAIETLQAAADTVVLIEAATNQPRAAT